MGWRKRIRNITDDRVLGAFHINLSHYCFYAFIHEHHASGTLRQVTPGQILGCATKVPLGSLSFIVNNVTKASRADDRLPREATFSRQIRLPFDMSLWN